MSARQEDAAPEPRFRTFDEFLAAIDDGELTRWCRIKAKTANRPKLMSGRPAAKITALDVKDVLMMAKGRCHWCGSLAVERRPSGPDGRPLPWDPIGRRIGSLDHVRAFCAHSGENVRENLVWSCMWCNTWPSQRIPGSTDHGALPDEAVD